MLYQILESMYLFTMSLGVLSLQCENADLITNCEKVLHKLLI